ncbi:E3 ubiquitin-protein ligase PDZRN3-like isoform X3 [Mytilus galloprovincialis]|uniref:E3 ubiquitin-protein ligase PDZRN3-like isoform X3 n=1 Tax=Mytilus galloprovincialis TaxID=29158 RepID=UPI003F7B6FE8
MSNIYWRKIDYPPRQCQNCRHQKYVNGQDLSQSSHDEAVEAFRTAKEPIVVEVLRRENKNKMKSRTPTMVSIGTQTEEEIYGFIRPPTPPMYGINSNLLCQPASRRPVAFSPSAEMGLTDIEMAHGLEYDDAYFEERPYEIEYEEVVLHRSSNSEKLGLTLCYGSLEDEVTDIFISEVESCSVAAQDGRIREGDQILQINGIDVHSRDQAIKLFSERTSDITLLLARPAVQMDDGFIEDQNVLEQLRMDFLEKHHHDNMQIMASMLARGHLLDEEGGTTDTATTENSLHKHEKDSGVGRTDESTKNDESSELDAFDTECTNSPAATSKFRQGRGEYHRSDESFLSHDITDQEINVNDISKDECDKFREVLVQRCDSKSANNSPKKGSSRKNSVSSLEREIEYVNREMENIQIECQDMYDNHIGEDSNINHIYETLPSRSPRVVPRMGTRLEYVKNVQLNNSGDSWNQSPVKKQQKAFSEASTTSAYNTGESCRSTPLTLELNQVSDDSEKGFKNSMLCLASTTTTTPIASTSDTEKQTQTPCQTKESSSEELNALSAKNNNENKNLSKDQKPMGESLQDLYMSYADVMYTNEANLQHTIAIQQKLFQQQMETKCRRKNSSRPSSHSSVVSLQQNKNENVQLKTDNLQQQSPNCTPPDSSGQMEWVVKRRPDGSRYITRRPVRNKMLKERAKKISEERCGMTTDDDAMSEMKHGRYWSKEDRKRHFEKAKDHKKKREMMMKAKMETLKEHDEKKEVNILELSHRKMMKNKGRKVFDDFMTIQEMLAHGSRHTEGKTYNPLLSVTTV